MPEEHPAMMLKVPVGAIVVTVAFLTGSTPALSKTLPFILGKGPRSLARAREAPHALALMYLITSSARAKLSSLPYRMRRRTRRSANPMTPRPIFLFAFAIASISAVGYLLISMTLSRKRTARDTVAASFSQSSTHLPPNSLTILPRFIDPRLQGS